MKLTKKEVETIIQLEINWCLDHPDPTLNHDQMMGFMNGLKHALLLIMNSERVVRSVVAQIHRDDEYNKHDVSILDTRLE